MHKPFSQACENNKGPILEKIAPALDQAKSVLEIGSGTGQHAVFFAAHMPHLQWQCSDRRENLDGINAWRLDSGLPNLPSPLILDVTGHWPKQRFDAIYSANTCHIMSWAMVEAMFQGMQNTINPGGHLMIYGPFNYGGQFTADSNAHFNDHLKAVAPHQGIRDFEAVNALAESIGLQLEADHAMPANNRLLIWEAN